MSEADNRANLDDFVAGLKGVCRAVGAPSYAQLEKISGTLLRQQPPGGVRFMALAPSTASEILGGRRKQAPKWPWVLTFLTALQVVARQGGIDPAVVGTIEQWKGKHEAVLAAYEALPHPHPGGHQEDGAQGRADVIDPASDSVAAAVRETDSQADSLLEKFLAFVRHGDPQQGRRGGRAITPERESYVDLESGAEDIWTYEPQAVPVLLQTKAYAQAVLAQQLPGATAEELARLVERRMQRQSPRRHKKPRRLWAVVEESVFHRQGIDASVMHAQVEHLIDLVGEPHIALQVVSADTAGSPPLSEPMTIFRFPEPLLGDVVCLDKASGALYLHERRDSEHYGQLFDRLTLMAETRDSTRHLLAAIRDSFAARGTTWTGA